MTRRARIWWLTLAAAIAPGSALAQNHVALVVDNYPVAVTASLPVSTDAGAARPAGAAIADRLRALNYSVQLIERADAAQLRDGIAAFRAAAEKAEVALVYFRGQAVDVAGRNHLLAHAATGTSLPDSSSITLDSLADGMKGTRANVILLDAGYADLEQAQGAAGDRRSGLAQFGERQNFLVAMPAAPGKVVRREGRLRFSRAILGQLERPQIDWATFGADLRRGVFEDSREEQVPYVRSTIRPGIEVAALGTPQSDAVAQPTPDQGSIDFQCGHALGYAEAMSEFEERLRHEREALLAAEKSARETWAANEGARLMQAIDAGLCALDARLRDDITRLTETWIVQAVEKASIDSFVREVVRLADQARERSIEVVGRADLAQFAADRIAAAGRSASAHPGSFSEVQAQVTTTLIETRIGEILEGLRICK